MSVSPSLSVMQTPGDSLSRTTPSRASDHGIVVMSSDMEVRYMNGRASQLLGSVRLAETEPALPGLMPAVVEDFCAEILKTAAMTSFGDKNVSREVRRLAGNPEQPILLRGFALLNGLGVERSHVFLILQERNGQC